LTNVVTDALLFVSVASALDVTTTAVLMIIVGALTVGAFPLIVKLVWAEAAIVPRAVVTVSAPMVHGTEHCRFVRPAGKVSVTATLAAGEPPMF
jgi:hypothetical protein